MKKEPLQLHHDHEHHRYHVVKRVDVDVIQTTDVDVVQNGKVRHLHIIRVVHVAGLLVARQETFSCTSNDHWNYCDGIWCVHR